MNDEETTGRRILAFSKFFEHRGLLLPKKPLPSISDIFEILAFDLQRFFQRSIYPPSLFSFFDFLSQFLTIFLRFRMKIRKKKKRQQQTYYERTKANERIKFDFVRCDIKFGGNTDGKYAIKSERKFAGNAIAASINTYT